MLSKDELSNGRVFILKLRDAAGVPSQWMETLRGETARRWYTIYRSSDWAALRHEAAEIFRHAVSEDEAERTRASSRCVFIRPAAVNTEEIDRSTALLA